MKRKLVGENSQLLFHVCEYSGDILKAYKLGNDMLAFARSNPLLGLASNQLGIRERVCIANVGEGGYTQIFINPQIVRRSASTQLSMREGCLSFPNVRGDVTRPVMVEITHLRLINDIEQTVTQVFRGMDAIIMDHEIDHLDGVRCIDKMRNKTTENL